MRFFTPRDPMEFLREVYQTHGRFLRARADTILLMSTDPDTGTYRPRRQGPPLPAPDLTGQGSLVQGIIIRYFREGNPQGFVPNYRTRFPHF